MPNDEDMDHIFINSPSEKGEIKVVTKTDVGGSKTDTFTYIQ